MPIGSSSKTTTIYDLMLLQKLAEDPQVKALLEDPSKAEDDELRQTAEDLSASELAQLKDSLSEMIAGNAACGPDPIDLAPLGGDIETADTLLTLIQITQIINPNDNPATRAQQSLQGEGFVAPEQFSRDGDQYIQDLSKAVGSASFALSVDIGRKRNNERRAMRGASGLLGLPSAPLELFPGLKAAPREGLKRPSPRTPTSDATSQSQREAKVPDTSQGHHLDTRKANFRKALAPILASLSADPNITSSEALESALKTALGNTSIQGAGHVVLAISDNSSLSQTMAKMSLTSEVSDYTTAQNLPPISLTSDSVYDAISLTLNNGTRLKLNYATIAANPLQHALESVNWVQLNNHLHDLNEGMITVPREESRIRDLVSRRLTGPVDALDEGKAAHHQITAQMIEDYIEFMEFLVRTNQGNFSDIESQLRALLTLKELIQERATQTVDSSPDKLKSAWQRAAGLAQEKLQKAERVSRENTPGAEHLEAAVAIMKGRHDYENAETWKEIAAALVQGGLEDSIEEALLHISNDTGQLHDYLGSKSEYELLAVIEENQSAIRKARKALRSPSTKGKDGPIKGRK